eukprot:CAMPEP_0204263274 /NCGR_PEP_ID=MMETSP0468-20130131/8236_1 /ASSEMBLY_ACC=CAM_ASM_000383 /TAXON_ID=2969 /ORGANISM="Oxyrrhis marina" /LENGTH=384 /DNA_ID=CAMNT_0051238031 /DNA_START=8 /DNA_END=1162 /DNA_ORIENTATION=+
MVEDPIDALSPSGVVKSSFCLMYLWRVGKAPVFTVLLNTAIWGNYLYRIFMEPASKEQVCLLPDLLYAPNPGDWPRYLGYFLFTPNFVRTVHVTSFLGALGYTLERDRMGTFMYSALFVILSACIPAVCFFLNISNCMAGLESTAFAVAVVTHHQNILVRSDGVDKGVQVPFDIEPRWHIWAIAGLMLIFAEPGEACELVVGMVLGLIWVLKDPEVWGQLASSLKPARRHIALTTVLYVVGMFVAPLSVLQIQFDGNIDVANWSWWTTTFPSTPSLGKIVAEAPNAVGRELCILAKIVTIALPMIAMSERTHYACALVLPLVLMIMYVMQTAFFHIPHLGYVLLVAVAYRAWYTPQVSDPKARTGSNYNPSRVSRPATRPSGGG